MTVGFAILAHDRLDRAGALARHLAGHGPVAVHLDRRVADPGLGVNVLQTQASDWGRFGLVAAALDTAHHLLDRGASHVCLLSGACLPIRPVADLADHLANHPGRNFIESVAVERDAWVQDGLSGERFTLFHPFSHRRSPRLFSLSVDVQRSLGVRRRMPEGLVPHLGLQWWVLSARTLMAIMDDPRLPLWRRFFEKTWIPDESFFQTLVRAVAPDPPLATLHLNRFDPRGKPYVFHDDHLALLSDADAFFARKIDPDAEALYDHFLGQPPRNPRAPVDDSVFHAARAQERTEGRGALHPGRYPGGTTQTAVQTARPYMVLVGDDAALLDRAISALRDMPDLTLHGEIFATGAVPLAAPAWGNLPTHPKIRDYRPAQYLARLVWPDMADRTVFAYVPRPPKPEAGQIVGDGNARIVVIGDTGLLDAMRVPMPTRRRRRKPQRPREIWAWTRHLDPTALTRDLAAGAGPELDTLRAIAASDWTAPAGWTSPAPKTPA